MKDETSFCVLGAKLPSDDELNGLVNDRASQWLLYGLKSQKGRILAPIYDAEAEDDDAVDE